MRSFKTRHFARWAKKAGLSEDRLLRVVQEIAVGMVDADLGGGVIKKRVAAGGRGKRGALRTLLAYRRSDIVFFIFGFEKNERENIEQADLRALRLLAKHLLALDDRELKLALGAGELEELRSE